ncbi:MAG: methylaspartate mutase subunit E [Dehalococcoidales bacterium]|nr:methylaspartate mutase subunit E [Dehalococcoidales bacterium]
MQIKNQKLTEEEFKKERQEVLSQWPTGNEVDLEEAIEYHKSMPPGKVLPVKLQEAKTKGDIYTVTGMGKATIKEQIELWQYVQDEGQADLLGTSVDSLSRVLNFAAAEKGIQESLSTGKSVLNGVPIVNHGVRGVRQMVEAVNLPLSLRYGAVDRRLIDEIGLAGGHTGTAPDGLYDFWNMNSKLSLETSLRTRQYVSRLAGYYEEKGAPIFLSCQGLYDGGAVPPSMVSAAMLTQVLMLAEQGARHIGLHYHLRGNVVQDVAASGVVRQLAREYLDKNGYQDAETFLSVGLTLLKYPENTGSAFGIIGLNSLIAKLCGSQMNDIRTPAEAVTIPTKEDIAISIRCAKMVTNILKGQKIEVDHKAVQTESEREELEVRSILNRVLEMGDGDVAAGTVRAVESGVLDNPFATSPHVACKVLGVKDSEGAVRYLDIGNLPLPGDIIEFHREKVAERGRKQGRELDYETVINDIFSISQGFLVAEM